MPADYGEALSERELEIVKFVSDGLTNREIAVRAYLSPNTVKVHLRNIFTKTGVASRTELTVLALQEGWITVPGVTMSDNIEGPPPTIDAIIETPEPETPALPPWPRSRWATLAGGLALALMVLLLPQRPAGQASTPTLSGLVDQPEIASIAPVPTEEDGWQELAPLPVRRARMGLAASHGKIYAVGGVTEEGLTDRLDVYDIESDTWQSSAALPATLANVGAVTLPEGILVPGGCDASGEPSATTHLYDPSRDQWAEVAPLPQALCAYALAFHNARAYLFGGWDGTAYRAVAYVYDGIADTWEQVAAPAKARGFGAAAALSDRIFYVGGYDDKRELATCEVYLPEADRWEACAPLLLPRGGLGLVGVGGRLYALGGGWNNYLGFNERYDPASDTWTVTETPIVGEWRNLGVTAWDTSIYIVGGWSGDYVNRVYATEVLPWRLFIPTTFFSP